MKKNVEIGVLNSCTPMCGETGIDVAGLEISCETSITCDGCEKDYACKDVHMEEAPTQHEWFCSSCVDSNSERIFASKVSDAERNSFQVAVANRPKRKAAIDSMQIFKDMIKGEVEVEASSNKSNEKKSSSVKWYSINS